MKKETIIEPLEHLAIPDIEMPCHRAVLRAALLSSSRFSHNRRSVKTFLTSMNMSQKTTALGGALIGIVAAVVFCFANFANPSTAYAQAQETVKTAQIQAFKLSPEMRAELETTMNANMADTLAEAYSAPDLRRMTEQEYAQAGNTVFTVAPVGQPSDFVKPTTYLSYTGKNGKRVVLGLNSENVLVMKIMEFSNGTIGIQGNMQSSPTTENQNDQYEAGTLISE